MNLAFISLGDMLTFIGLIVAVYQLAKPRYVLVWKLSSIVLKSLAILLLLAGYLSPLAAIITPDIKDLHILWMTLSLNELLQTTGFILITLGSLVVAYIYSRFNRSHLIINFTKFKLTFHRYPTKNWRVLNFQMERNKLATTRSARKFYGITSMYLVRGHTEEVVEIIHYNLKSLVHSARQYNPERFRMDDEPERKPAKENGPNYTFETLYQILTDEVAMKHICTNNRPFLHAIVWQENQSSDWSINNEFTFALYENIMEHLVLNAGSFLYTQKDTHNGSARFANIYELLTDDKIIRRQDIIPSQLTWNVSKADVPLDAYVDVLSKLLEPMIDSYKKQPNEQVLSNIRSIMDQLIGNNGVTRRIAYDKKARERHANDIVNSAEANLLRMIEMHIIHNLYKDKDPDSFKNNDAELKSENKRSTYQQKTFTGLAAHKASELIEDLTVLYSDTDDSDYHIRMAMFECLNIYVDTQVANRYKELLLDRLFDKAVDGKIEQHSTNIQGYYPNVFRALVDYLIPFTPRSDNFDAQAQNRLKRVMANELKEALLNDKKMSNDEPMKDVLLPSSVKVTINKNKKTVTYYYINQKGKKQILNLDEQSTIVTVPKVTNKKRKKAGK